MWGEISNGNAHGRTWYKYSVRSTAVCISDRGADGHSREPLCQSEYLVLGTTYWEWPFKADATRRKQRPTPCRPEIAEQQLRSSAHSPPSPARPCGTPPAA